MDNNTSRPIREKGESCVETGLQVERKSRKLGRFTFTCRSICTALVAAPLIYRIFVTDGDAYHFLALVLLAPVAGLVLVANSVFCLFRYRKIESFWISIVFILVGVIGVIVTWHFLPQFRM